MNAFVGFYPDDLFSKDFTIKSEFSLHTEDATKVIALLQKASELNQFSRINGCSIGPLEAKKILKSEHFLKNGKMNMKKKILILLK